MSAQDASGTLLRGGVVVNHDGSSVSDVLVSSLTGKVVAVQNHIDLDWSEKVCPLLASITIKTASWWASIRHGMCWSCSGSWWD